MKKPAFCVGFFVYGCFLFNCGHQMTIQFVGGPLDGAVRSVNSKRIPSVVEVHLKGCAATGFRSALYEYHSTSQCFHYVISDEMPFGEPVVVDAVAKDWMKLEGAKNDGGGRWQSWKWSDNNNEE